MESIKKYFEFSGTINGLNYFLRNIITTIVSFIGGYLVGMGITSGNIGYASLGFLLVGPSLWMGVCTIYKRMNALFPTYASIGTAVLLSAQVSSQFFGDDEPIKGIFGLSLLIVGLILIFKNSGIGNHNG